MDKQEFVLLKNPYSSTSYLNNFPSSTSSSATSSYTHLPMLEETTYPAASTKLPPHRRRRNIIIGTLALILVLAAGVIVAVEVLRRHRGPHKYTQQELYFPTGGSNGALGNGTATTATYDELLVFGSSYSDDAHPRPEQYRGSMSPKGYWNGRWSNGPVWVEYLTQMLGSNVTMRNYAYGGAVVQHFLSPTGPPTMGVQMQTYLGELSRNYTSASPAAASAILQRKALVPTFTTTNDIDAVYRNYLDPANINHNNLTLALETISDSASLFIEGLRSLIPPVDNGTASGIQRRIAPDFLILPISPFDMTPKARQMAAKANTTTLAAKQITMQYNHVLLEGARSLAQTLGDRGNVFTYDTTAWFEAMAANPSQYDLARIDKGCSAVQCTDPNQYIWWDNLHLVTEKQQILAHSCAQVLSRNITSHISKFVI